MGYLDGFKIPIKQMGKRQRVTVPYPKEKAPQAIRRHGRHVLNRYEDGMEKCIGCELCAGVCPARCIYVRGADNPVDDPVSPGERYGFIYEINYLRCIHCDLCVEACPTEAITETKLFEFSFTNRADAIYTKDELLVDDDGLPQHLPVGGLAPGRGRAHLGLDAGHRPVGQRRLRGPGRLVGRARLRRPRPRGRPGRRRRPVRPRSRGGPDWRRGARARQRIRGALTRGSRHLHRLRGHRAGRRPRRGAVAQPGALGAEPGGHAVRHRRAVPQPGRPAPRRRAGHRLHRRHRRAHPVRAHAARRRHRRRPRRSSPSSGSASWPSSPAWPCWARCSPCSSPARTRSSPAPTRPPRAISDDLSNIAQLGRQIFTTWIFAFEITAGLLTIAVIGAVVMARRPDSFEPLPEPSIDDRRRPLRRRGRCRRGRAHDPRRHRPRVTTNGSGFQPYWYLVLGAMLFCIGAVGLLVRRNPLVMFMCVELMLNAVNLTFVTFGRDARRHRRSGHRVLRAGRRRRRGGRRASASSWPSCGAGPDATADDISALRG